MQAHAIVSTSSGVIASPFTVLCYDGAIELAPPGYGPGLLDAQMFLALAGYKGFLPYILHCLGSVRGSKRGGKVRFPVFPSIAERNDMIAIPYFAC